MVIISQDKKCYINYENICYIKISNSEQHRITAYFSDACSVLLGSYDTDEQAQKIMTDLKNCIEIYHEKHLNFKMPE